MLLQWGHKHELKIPEGGMKGKFQRASFQGWWYHFLVVHEVHSVPVPLHFCSAKKMFCLICPPLSTACRWCYLCLQKSVGLCCPSDLRESERASYNYWRTLFGLMPRPWGPLYPLRMIILWQDEKIYFKVTLTILTPKVLAVQNNNSKALGMVFSALIIRRCIYLGFAPNKKNILEL